MTANGWHVLDTHIDGQGPLPTSHGALPCPAREGACGLTHRTLTEIGELVDGEFSEDIRTRINAWAIDDCRDFAVHAGVVSVAGRAVAFPAPSGAGKSVLTAAAVMAGASYVSDEALVTTWEGGQVRPYPKPINLDQPALTLLGLRTATPAGRKAAIDPATLGARPGVGAVLDLETIVVLQRRPSGVPGLATASTADAAELLLRLSFNHFRDPIASVKMASTLARKSRCVVLTYSEPLSAAGLLLEAASA